jgi:5-methylcytosine-specific restriction endonuclease McrA
MENDYSFIPHITDEEIKKEKARARQLRNTSWWRQKKSRGICYYCKRKFPPNELTMDHLIPLIRGGKSIKSNLVPACKECNNRKKYMLPFEWEESLREKRTE